MTVSPPGRSSLRLGGHEAQRALHPLRCRGAQASTMTAAAEGRRGARGRVVEADRAADELRGRAAAAVEDLVALADRLTGSRGARRRSAGVAHAARCPCRAARARGRRAAAARLPSSDLEPAAARGDDVKHQAAWHRRQFEAPRRRELGAAVEGAVMRRKCSASPSGSTDVQGWLHLPQSSSSQTSTIWTNGQVSAIFDHCESADTVLPMDGRNASRREETTTMHPRNRRSYSAAPARPAAGCRAARGSRPSGAGRLPLRRAAVRLGGSTRPGHPP